MIKVIDIDEIKFKSINKKFIQNKITKKFKLTKEYSYFKKILLYSIKRPIAIIDPPYQIDVYQMTYLDIDNTIKVIMDCLEERRIISNDREVIKLNIYKLKKKRGYSSSLKVFVGNIDENIIKKKFDIIKGGGNNDNRITT